MLKPSKVLGLSICLGSILINSVDSLHMTLTEKAWGLKVQVKSCWRPNNKLKLPLPKLSSCVLRSKLLQQAALARVKCMTDGQAVCALIVIQEEVLHIVTPTVTSIVSLIVSSGSKRNIHR